MPKVTDIRERTAFGPFLDDWVGVYVSETELDDDVENFVIARRFAGRTALTREQAEFVLPHLQRWLEEK